MRNGRPLSGGGFSRFGLVITQHQRRRIILRNIAAWIGGPEKDQPSVRKKTRESQRKKKKEAQRPDASTLIPHSVQRSAKENRVSKEQVGRVMALTRTLNIEKMGGRPGVDPFVYLGGTQMKDGGK